MLVSKERMPLGYSWSTGVIFATPDTENEIKRWNYIFTKVKKLFSHHGRSQW